MLWFQTALIGEAWTDRVRVGVEGGLIASIEPGVEPQPGDERHIIGLPGLPNVHSHSFQRAMAGRTEARASASDDFWSWRDLMYRFANTIDPDQLQAVAAFAFAEMLEAGFTRVGEFHYVHHAAGGGPYANPAEMSARIAAAAAESGIALTLLPVFYAHSGFGGTAPGEAQRRFVHDIGGYGRLAEGSREALAALPDAVLGIAPHSLRAVTPGELRALLSIAPAGPVHIHIAEQLREVEDCLAWSGRRPVEHLMGEVPVDARWCLVHATHVSEDERRALAGSGAVAGLCPITEANLGDGVFPAAAFLDEGGRIAIGSDSNVRIDASEEMRLLEYGQRLTLRRRGVLASAERPSVGARLFQAALEGGAQALGAPAGIAVGNAAELVSLDARGEPLTEDAIIDSWVFAANPTIDCVWRRGEKLVAGGRHVRRDALAARYRVALEGLLQA